MAIKEVLELVGSDVVIKQLSDVKKAGEDTLAVFNKPLPELKFPEPDTKPTEDLTGHVLKLKDALHTLRPILQAAGVQIGEFGAFARLASGSVLGLGTALAGAIIVGLAKLEENAARTRGKLTDLFGSTGKGEDAFAALEKQAKQFGSTVEGLAPGLESFQAALNAVDRTAKGFVALKAEDLPGAQIAKNADAASTAYGNFIKLLRAGRLTQDEAEKSAKAFFDTLKDGGPITSAALKALPVGTVNELKQALGAAGLTTQAFFAAVDAGQISIDKFQQSLLTAGTQAERAFQIKSIKTFGDELNKLFTTLNSGFQKLTGKGFADFVVGELARITKGIQDTLDEWDKLVLLFNKLNEIGQKSFRASVGAVEQAIIEKARGPVGPTLEQAGLVSAKGGEAPFPTPEQAGKAGQAAGDAFNQGFLKKGFVFPPAASEQAGADIGANLTKGFNKFITAPTTEATTALVEPIKNIIETGLTVPAEAQQQLVEQFAQTGTQSAESFNTGFQTTIPQTLSLFQALYDQIKTLFAQPIPVNFDSSLPGGFGAGFAGGGMVRGPGSGTSDSILAWLSNREFVVNAKATSAYLPLLQAINAMRLPLDVGQFNMGGLTRVLGNRFASGGVVSSAGNRSLTLVLDQKKFSLSGSKGTIDDLEREASLRGLAMIGKAPSWIR